jgi:hypothetical protein
MAVPASPFRPTVQASLIPRGQRLRRQITDIFSQVGRQHLDGIVWYADVDGAGRDYRLEDNPTALAAFRAGVRKLQRSAAPSSP